MGFKPYSSVFLWRYPYNNFLHHHIENILMSCLESKNAPLINHLLQECNLIGRILEAEKNNKLETDSNKVVIHFIIMIHISISEWASFSFSVLAAYVETGFDNMFLNSLLQPTVPAEGRSPPRIGNIGHLKRISNKLVQLGNTSSEIQAYLQVYSWVLNKCHCLCWCIYIETSIVIWFSMMALWAVKFTSLQFSLFQLCLCMIYDKNFY